MEFIKDNQIFLELMLWDSLKSLRDIKENIDLKKINKQELIDLQNSLRECVEWASKSTIE